MNLPAYSLRNRKVVWFFLAVLLATMIVVALLGRLLRGVCHLAGLGVADVVLGILFSLAKTVVVLSLAASLLGFFLSLIHI